MLALKICGINEEGARDTLLDAPSSGSSSGEHKCVLAARDDELQKWDLQKASFIRECLMQLLDNPRVCLLKTRKGIQAHQLANMVRNSLK